MIAAVVVPPSIYGYYSKYGYYSNKDGYYSNKDDKEKARKFAFRSATILWARLFI